MLAELQAKLLTHIVAYRPLRGETSVLSDAVIDAYKAMPRHEFVRKFKLVGQSPNADVFERGRGRADELIYSNQPLMYVDDNLKTLDASNSEPAFILHLLSLLDLQPGHRVLEVGCGTGWLLSLISSVIGPQGSVVGVEIIDSLAMQAAENIRRLNINNAEVVAGDGLAFIKNVETFDRIIFTASALIVPAEIIAAVKKGGKVVIPLRNRGLTEEVYLFERTDSYLKSLASRLCRFVPLRTEGASDFELPKKLRNDYDMNSMLRKYKGDLEFPLSFGNRDSEIVAAAQFSSFMAKCDPSFEMYWVDFADNSDGANIFGNRIGYAFGIVDKHQSSASLWMEGRLFTFGDDGAAEAKFKELFSMWKRYAEPYGSDFALDIHPWIGEAEENLWIEKRGSLFFNWRLPLRK